MILTRCRQAFSADRRRVICSLAALLLAASPLFAAPPEALDPTPEQMLGPFYPLRPDADAGNDLTQGGRARGTPLTLSGRVLDTRGKALAGVLVEIWQTNAHGRYHHPDDQSAQPLDPDFNGYGRYTSGLSGEYRFSTIVPVTYPGRTPHIHFRLSRGEQELLVTQMYLPGEPLNERDGLFRSVSDPAQRRQLIGVPDAPASLRFDIVIETTHR